MNEVSRKYDDEAIVARLRQMIRQGKTDHWLGMQARLLIEPRWVDTGSGPGREAPFTHTVESDDELVTAADDLADLMRRAGVIELPDERGSAWERHDDPEQDL